MVLKQLSKPVYFCDFKSNKTNWYTERPEPPIMKVVTKQNLLSITDKHLTRQNDSSNDRIDPKNDR